MKFEDITKGVTLYHSRADKMKGDTRDYKKRPVENLRYFVLDLDPKKKKIFASCNGANPTWYSSNAYRYWDRNKPDN